MKQKIILSLVISVLVAGIGAIAYYYHSRSQIESQASDANAIKTTNQNTPPIVESNYATPLIRGDAKTEHAELEQSDRYQPYSLNTLSAGQRAGYKVVLFFHAPWCPFCKSADSAFEGRANEIPQNTLVLKTDYDSNKELRKRYGINYQHTFVLINSTGEALTQWVGGDIENVIKYTR